MIKYKNRKPLLPHLEEMVLYIWLKTINKNHNKNP